MGEVEAHVELQLRIIRRHVAAQLVKGLVVFGFAQVGELMRRDHVQEGLWGHAEQGGDADLPFCPEPTAVHAGHAGVGAEGLVDGLQRAVVAHLGEGRRGAQEAVAERGHIVVERGIAAQAVGVRVALLQPGAEAAGGEGLGGLGADGFGVAQQVGQGGR